MTKLAGIWEAAPAEIELRPFVVVPMCAVPDGKMPKGARAVVRAALAAGLGVWTTFTVVLMPGVRKLVRGERVEIGQDAGARNYYVKMTETVESVVVRLRTRDAAHQAWAAWHNGRFEHAFARRPGALPWRLSSGELSAWIGQMNRMPVLPLTGVE